jgi:peptidoglycan/xylan/chitin deacetylase (PgdA/CDA1 family)
MWKTTALRAGFEAIHWTGLSRAMAPVWSGRGVIFCLHHVTPQVAEGFAPNANLEITPQFLEEIILLVKRKGYALLPIADAVEQLKRKPRGGDRFAVFTLDDGYKDNLIHAMPVFEKNACPFTVYAAPRIAEGTCELWWRGLEAIIAQSERMSVKVGESTFDFATRSETCKWQAWSTLFPLVKAQPEYAQRDWIRREADRCGVDLDAMCRNTAMTWDELRSMNRNTLATIGAHTLNHYNLAKLSEADARREIIESGQCIAAELGEDIRHFAFPYGNKDAAGPREFRLCREADYDSAVVTRLGTLTSAHAAHLHALPRVMVSSRYEKSRYVEALLSGVPARLANRGAALNVD